jgi:hypothetical protein
MGSGSGRSGTPRPRLAWRARSSGCSQMIVLAARSISSLMLIVRRCWQVWCWWRSQSSRSIARSCTTTRLRYGEYAQADGRQRGGQATAIAARGHSKDHRPDLKQLVLILIVCADGAVPLAHRLADGNTTDDQTHIATWDGLLALLGDAHFLYVADCKLCTREQMVHIDRRGGRFVTVLPRSRAEDARLREWMTSATPSGLRLSAVRASARAIPCTSGGCARRRFPRPRATGSPGCTQAPSSTTTSALAQSGSSAPVVPAPS